MERRNYSLVDRKITVFGLEVEDLFVALVLSVLPAGILILFFRSFVSFFVTFAVSFFVFSYLVVKFKSGKQQGYFLRKLQSFLNRISGRRVYFK